MMSRLHRIAVIRSLEVIGTAISRGCAIGYRRGGNGGSWIARFRDEAGHQHYQALGAADDARDPDGLSAFSFAQAQDRARTFFVRAARELARDLGPHEGSYTVGMAIEDYLIAREKRGSKGVRADRYAAEARIIPEIGNVEVAKTTSKGIRDWHQTVASSPKLLRTKKKLLIGPQRKLMRRTSTLYAHAGPRRIDF